MDFTAAQYQMITLVLFNIFLSVMEELKLVRVTNWSDFRWGWIGTTVNQIEVLGNVDDGIEILGGTVKATNLLVWGQGDDAIDIDQAYAGTIDGALVVLTAASDHGFEIDGPEGSAP